MKMVWIKYDKNVLKLLVPILLVIWSSFIFKLALNDKNMSFLNEKLEQNKVPSILEGSITEKEYRILNLTTLMLVKLSLLFTVCAALIPTVIFVFQIYKPLWDLCLKIRNIVGAQGQTIPMALFMVLTASLRILIPTTTFLLYRKYGLKGIDELAEQTNIFEQIMFLLGIPLTSYLILILVRKKVSLFLITFWITIMVFTAHEIWSSFDSSSYITIMDEYPDGELKEGLRNLSRVTGFPFDRMFYDPKNEGTNAVCSRAFGFSTIIFQGKMFSSYRGLKNESKILEINEILGIACHELGHWKYAHTQYIIIVQQVFSGVILIFLFYLLKVKGIYELAGFHSTKKDENVVEDIEGEHANDDEKVPLMMGVYIGFTIIEIITSLKYLVINPYSRGFEYEADRYAKELGYVDGLENGLIKLVKMSGIAVDEDRLYGYFMSNHPSLVERIQALRN